MQNRYNFYIVSICFLISLAGCKSKLTKEEYLQWMKNEQKGLVKKKQIGAYEFEVQYKTPAFVLISGNDKESDPEKINSRIKELEQMQYFDLKIRHRKGEDFIKTNSNGDADYYKRLYYYSFAFQNDIKIEQNDTTYDCQLFHFERSYGLAATRTFVLGFGQPEKQGDKTILIDAHDLGVGVVKIKFRKEDIDNIPNVQL